MTLMIELIAHLNEWAEAYTHILLVTIAILSPLIAAAYYSIAYLLVPGLGVGEGMKRAMRAFFIGCGTHHLIMGILAWEHAHIAPLILLALVLSDLAQVIGGAWALKDALRTGMSFVIKTGDKHER